MNPKINAAYNKLSPAGKAAYTRELHAEGGSGQATVDKLFAGGFNNIK